MTNLILTKMANIRTHYSLCLLPEVCALLGRGTVPTYYNALTHLFVYMKHAHLAISGFPLRLRGDG